jgi:hypothetical protein
MKKKALTYASGLAVGFYTTFVAEHRWNWFAVGVLKATSIGYWQMYGLMLLLGLLVWRDYASEDKHRWAIAFMKLDAYLPEDKRPSVAAAIKEQDEQVWLEAGFAVVTKLFGNSIALGLGWTVHTFLV